ncbi:prepilin-type N-terminal cleavage/methylation domain-containing protein [Pseudohaliea sp.]|uniref:prepilin-type N-terminal cleavage/methylation domain-containing protein n=1 Tax=Pseudohaliea sp. TaxID=2740289 RepID=UPI0032ED4AD1
MMRAAASRQGFALVEVLVALLVFSIAIAGALRAQLGALAATRDTLAQVRASRSLQDLVQRGLGENLAMLAPASLPVAGGDPLPGAAAALGGWASLVQDGLVDARLCILRRGVLLEVAIAWRPFAPAVPVACDGAAPRVVAYLVAP